MLWSKMFIPTLRERPAEEALRPAALMARAGYASVQSGRIVAYLPLGQRCLHKIEQLVRSSLLGAGAQEFSLRTAARSETPLGDDSTVATSGSGLYPGRRATAASAPSDVPGALLGIASSHLRSYRELPQLWFCFGLRPARSSVGNENCCLSLAIGHGIDAGVHDPVWGAFSKVVEECSVNSLTARAPHEPERETSAEERVVLSSSGGADVAVCRCGHAADLECATSRVEGGAGQEAAPEEPQLVETPGKRTIAAVSEFLGVPAASIIKSLLYVVAGEPVLVLLLGSDQLNESLLSLAVGMSEVRPADADEVMRTFGAEPGSIGPVSQKRIRVIADNALRGRRNMVCGANRDDYHLVGVQPERHFHAQYFHLRRVCDADPCPDCGHPLSIKPARLLMRSSVLQSADRKIVPVRVLGPDNKLQSVPVNLHVFYLDSFLLALFDNFSDDAGVILPRRVAPFDVIMTPIDYRDNEQKGVSRKLHAELTENGLDVLLDDRDSSPGVKFKDADLIGVPLRITVGPKKLKDGMVELRLRKTGESFDCRVEEAARLAVEKLSH